MANPDWRQIVRQQAAATGADDLPLHALDELAVHLDDIYRAARKQGASGADARERALAALRESHLVDIVGPSRRLRDPVSPGNAAGFTHPSPLRSLNMMHALRLAIRQFTQHRAFALVTVLVLGLGVGAAVAVYSIVDGVLLKPLPYQQPDQLITWWDTNHEQGLSHEPVSPVNFLDYRELEVFEDAAAWWRPDVNLADPGLEPVRVSAIETGANLFEVLGVQPQVGPGFPADGPMYSQDLIAVISERLWRTRYGADPSLIGRALQLNGTPYTIVGVMPARFHFPDDVDVWQRSRWDFSQHSRGAHFMEVVARLAPGVSVEQADAAMTGLAQRLANENPQTNEAWSVRTVSLLDDMLGYYRPALIVLFGAVGLLMVIGCLNVASLLLTRALSREREMAVRTALGASPKQLIVQLLAEALVISLAGAAVGTVAAAVALPLITATTPLEIPRLTDVTINLRVLGFALALAVGTTLVFGLVPALAIVRRSLTADLKTGDRGTSRGTRLAYRGLVAGEVALAAALLISSGLLVRTVTKMTDIDAGVTNGHALIASMQLSGAAYPDWPSVAGTYGRFVDRLREQPGVRSAGAANFLPFEAGWRIPFSIEGQPPVRPEDAPQAQFQTVLDGYFETMGARMVEGRAFTPRDTADMPGAVVVNEAFVQRFLRDQPPLSAVLLRAVIQIGPLGRIVVPGNRWNVVGVVADVRNAPLGQPIEPTVYFTGRQFPFRSMSMTIEAVDQPAAVAAMRATLREIAPTIPLTTVQTWDDRLAARSAEPRLLMTLLVVFGGLAGVLAALGVYGLFAWMVALRRRELAIRLTLGARPGGLGLSVIRQGAVLVLLGLVAGGLVVQAASATLARVLFEVSPRDVGSTMVAAAVLLAATLMALLPAAVRAMRIDPIEGLRTE
jgi:predicted permease